MFEQPQKNGEDGGRTKSLAVASFVLVTFVRFIVIVRFCLRLSFEVRFKLYHRCRRGLSCRLQGMSHVVEVTLRQGVQSRRIVGGNFNSLNRNGQGGGHLGNGEAEVFSLRILVRGRNVQIGGIVGITFIEGSGVEVDFRQLGEVKKVVQRREIGGGLENLGIVFAGSSVGVDHRVSAD